MLVFLILLLTLLFSAICFGGAVSAKINRENDLAANPPVAGTAAVGLTQGEKYLANTSLVVAVVAILFSFISFYQGGFK